ncbi:MAG TPA: retropepsin-like aspartic protease [Steroidobacteraceae bacterium]|nr:retropepsin-like aspartic protease [Steroidobacteraceae bacterium]
MRIEVLEARRLQPALGAGLLLAALLSSLGHPAAGAPASSPPNSAISGSDPGAVSEEASLFALPTTHDHIGRVVVATMVNGKGPYRFIVDTGATHSTVSPRLVEALGLQPSEMRSIVLDGITGTAQVSAVTLDRLQTGDLTLDQLVAPVVGTPVMAGADGILGAAGLTGRSLSVDFQRNLVRISRGVDLAVRAEALRIHAAGLTHGLMTLSMQVGRVRGLALIDTGSERTLGNPALRDALKLRSRTGAAALVTSVYGATEQVENGEIWRAPTILIDTMRINDVQVVYGDFHIFKVWQMQDTPALIVGMDVLGTVNSLAIDFRNEDVYFTSSRTNTMTFAPTGNLSSTLQKK